MAHTPITIFVSIGPSFSNHKISYWILLTFESILGVTAKLSLNLTYQQVPKSRAAIQRLLAQFGFFSAKKLGVMKVTWWSLNYAVYYVIGLKLLNPGSEVENLYQYPTSFIDMFSKWKVLVNLFKMKKRKQIYPVAVRPSASTIRIWMNANIINILASVSLLP